MVVLVCVTTASLCEEWHELGDLSLSLCSSKGWESLG